MSSSSNLAFFNPTNKELDLIRKTVAKDATPEELDHFMHVAKTYNLNPLTRQIYMLIYGKNDNGKRSCVFMQSIDGMRAIADRTKSYRPDDNPPTIVTCDSSPTNPSGIFSITVFCYKMDQNKEWYRVAGTAYWDEFVPLKKNWKKKEESEPDFYLEKDSMWCKKPILMLSKCAEAQALRKGWPNDFSGLYVDAEMDKTTDALASERLEDFEESKRHKRVNSSDSILVQWRVGDPLTFVTVGEFADKVLSETKLMQKDDVKKFMEINKAALQQFWAFSPNDSMELKKELEKLMEV